MLFLRHATRMFGSVVSYGITTRRVGMLLAVVLGAIAVTLAAATSAVVPLVVYPFV